MTLPASITRDPEYKKAVSLGHGVDSSRIAQCLHAYDLQLRKYTIMARYKNDDGETTMRSVGGTEIVALANGRELRTAQEWAKVGEFITAHEPNTTRYSRIAKAVSYQRIIAPAELVEMIEDTKSWRTVEQLQSALADIAYSKTGYDAKRITNTLYRMANGGAKLIGLNGDLPEAIRADVEEAYRLNSNALQYMKEVAK